MTGYGEVVRESAEERHERHVEAVIAVLRTSAFVMSDGPGGPPSGEELRELGEECLAAAQAGF